MQKTEIALTLGLIIIAGFYGYSMGLNKQRLSREQIADNIEYLVFEDKYPHQYLRQAVNGAKIDDLKHAYTYKYPSAGRILLEVMADNICHNKLTPNWWEFNYTYNNETYDLINEMEEFVLEVS